MALQKNPWGEKSDSKDLELDLNKWSLYSFSAHIVSFDVLITNRKFLICVMKESIHFQSGHVREADGHISAGLLFIDV